MLRGPLSYILKKLAKAVVDKYQPQIIGITGSVGKTTTKEAILMVLAKKYRIRGNIKNYNNEIGLPLTILGLESPGRSIIGWLSVIRAAFNLLHHRDANYPEFVVLEMGVDHPGDIDYLLSIVKPTIGVVTAIGQAHLEFFGSQDKIAAEKAKLITSLPPDGYSILNADDQRVLAMAEHSQAKVITYGFGSQAMVRASDLSFNYEKSSQLAVADLPGLEFNLNYQDAVIPLVMTSVISEAVVSSVLAAVAVGLSQGIGLLDITKALVDFHVPKGRLNILSGSRQRVLLDDSYNASPTSVVTAVNILSRLPVDSAKQRVAILGDMLELGVDGPAEHRRLGQIIAQLPIGQLVLIGPLAGLIGQEAQQQGWVGKTDYFPDAVSASSLLDQLIPSAAVVLLKGSQGTRLEKLTKILLADQTKAADCLVRQEERWLNS